MKKGKKIRAVPPVKRIHYFGRLGSRRTRFSAERLGGKGASLAYMRSLGLPVPPGFTITTEVCAEYYDRGQKLPPGLMDQVEENLAKLEKEMGKGFGATENPLLVSVRSGAAASMPGMMDTILNLGLNDENAEWMAEVTENERATFDAYRRLIHMFGDVVMGVDHEYFEDAFAEIKEKYGAIDDTEVPAKGLRELVRRYKKIYRKHTKESFPQDPHHSSTWPFRPSSGAGMPPGPFGTGRSTTFTGYLGTAVTVQAMVFGNLDDCSGTGVCFHPESGHGGGQALR